MPPLLETSWFHRQQKPLLLETSTRKLTPLLLETSWFHRQPKPLLIKTSTRKLKPLLLETSWLYRQPKPLLQTLLMVAVIMVVAGKSAC
jgi:hypothetical protein